MHAKKPTYIQWDQWLPIVLLRIRSSPTKPVGLSPFEMRFGVHRFSQGPASHPETTDTGPWFDSLKNQWLDKSQTPRKLDNSHIPL
jgi:hypothetical protein